MVRRLCKRSASFIITTRTSSAVARAIFWKYSAWLWSLSLSSSCSNLVIPSTNLATFDPNSFFTVFKEISQSSTTSCNNPAIIVSASIFNEASIRPTLIGCIRKGSPLLRNCPSCALSAKSTAFFIF